MNADLLARFHGVIPAGGVGTRLWPLSRASAPKFLHDLTGKVVAPLFLRVYGTLQFRLRLLSTDVPGALEELALGFEEENRSHVLLQLERAVYRKLKILLRYTLFVGDLQHPEGGALRHLLFLGLGYRYDGK